MKFQMNKNKAIKNARLLTKSIDSLDERSLLIKFSLEMIIRFNIFNN